MTSQDSVIDQVLFVTFAPEHFSALRRLEAGKSDLFLLLPWQTKSDKISQSVLQRVFSGDYVRLLFSLVHTNANIVWVWGHDAGFIASLGLWFRRDVKLIWDISDVNKRLLGDSWLSRILRSLEKLLVGRADMLFITSPSFYDRHFCRLVRRERVRVIENRRSASQAGPVSAPPSASPLRIVFAGIFRSPEVMLCMIECAARLKGKVVFDIYGYPNRAMEQDVLLALQHAGPHLRMHGRFDASNIHNVYSLGHLVWGFTDPDENENEKWLLSNRIYDGIVTRRPVLTTQGTTSGDYVLQHRLGLALPMKAEMIVDALLPLIDTSSPAYLKLVAQMPDPATGYMNRDYGRAIEELLDA